VQDVATVEVAGSAHAPVRQDERRVFAEEPLELVRLPDVIASLMPLGVRVEGSVKAPVRRRHLTRDPADRRLGDAPDLLVPRRLPQVRPQPNEERVVVQHLLEVRHEPLGVHAVAGKAAAHLIVQPAAGHLPVRVLHHLQRLRLARARPVAQEEVQRHRRRKLGGAVEAAEPGLVALHQRGHRTREQRLVQAASGPRALRGRRVQLAHGLGGSPHAVLAVRPRIGHPLEHPGEGGHSVPVGRRIVGAGVERLALGGEEDGHRPATLARHRLRRLHVDRVEVGPLLAVHLDADEALVHERRGCLVLERLALHHVAPVTGRVADAEEDRRPPCPRLGERRLAPRPPRHRVVRVLEQVGAGLGREMIGHVQRE
jgi:hypothetical protein